jgi:hypothetical protein
MFSDEEAAIADWDEFWRNERHKDTCEGRWRDDHDDDGDDDHRRPGHVEHGDGFLYRPRQVLLEAAGDLPTQRAQREIEQRGGVPDPELDRSFAVAGLPVQAFLLPSGVNLPELVTELRQSTGGQPPPNVGLNHVFCGEPDYHGGPYGEPYNTKGFSEAPYSKPAEVAPAIAVLDTGYDQAVQQLHPGLVWRLDYTPADQENAVLPSGYIAPEGGHGLFIAGIIMRLAPHVAIRQVKVLDPAGVTDDATAAVGLARAGAPVVNLSFGGYTHENTPPTALATALARYPDVVMVAAAGNNHEARKFWPAAFPQVVAVGAVDTRHAAPKRAVFSNYGPWVDVYAPGVQIQSTYLKAMWKLRSDPTARLINGYATWSGTSFAAPQVAALIAQGIPAAGSARAAETAVLASATQLAGLGPVLLPNPGVVG